MEISPQWIDENHKSRVSSKYFGSYKLLSYKFKEHIRTFSYAGKLLIWFGCQNNYSETFDTYLPIVGVEIPILFCLFYGWHKVQTIGILIQKIACLSQDSRIPMPSQFWQN